MKRRFLAAVLATVLILSLSGCFRIPYLMPTNSSSQIERYLEEKYGGTFKQARSGMYTRGDNSADYWYYEVNDPDLIFNVYDDDGELSDDYEEKKVLYQYGETVTELAEARGGQILYHPARVFQWEEGIEEQELFCYIVINRDTIDAETMRGVLEEAGQGSERKQIVALYTMNGQDFEALLEFYAKYYAMNDTYAGQYDSTLRYRFVYDKGEIEWEGPEE